MMTSLLKPELEAKKEKLDQAEKRLDQSDNLT